jgi:1,4-alpha-glucan branching enzyme
MPYVEGYGTWPFGEEWLWEAMATSYLPLLDVLEAAPELTLSLTPVLCDQLAAPGVGERFAAFLRDVRPETHRRDIADAGDPAVAAELERSAALYAHAGERFGALGGDLLAALAPHAAWTSSATHAVLPLLATDAGVRLQVRTGVESHRARFAAARPWRGGFWSPECAHGAWLDPLLEEEGVHATCVDLTDVLGRGSEPPAPAALARRTAARAHRPLGLRARLAPDGYPARRRTATATTRPTTSTSRGATTARSTTRGRARPGRADAQDFVGRVERRIAGGGLCVCALDTELLGHWWARASPGSASSSSGAGARACRSCTSTTPSTVEPVPAPPGLPVTRGAASATCRPGRRRRRRPRWSARDAELRAVADAASLRPEAVRELLALQASDWAFVVAEGLATPYGRERAAAHRAAFDAAGATGPRSLAPRATAAALLQP